MTSGLLTPTLAAAIVAVGLTAGFLAAFAHTVMPALATADDEDFVGGFQALDRAVYNPWFMAPFTLAPVLVGAALILALPDAPREAAALLAAALALAVATVLITAAVHLPLNRYLADVAPNAGGQVLAGARARFERRWVLWNYVRTISATGSFACLVVALARAS